MHLFLLCMKITLMFGVFCRIQERALAFRREGFGVKMESELPHLVCVDDDILSTGVTLYHLRVSWIEC